MPTAPIRVTMAGPVLARRSPERTGASARTARVTTAPLCWPATINSSCQRAPARSKPAAILVTLRVSTVKTLMA
jgi:hypothetical protein